MFFVGGISICKPMIVLPDDSFMKITPLECSCGQEVRLPSGERLYSDCEVESLREIIKGLQEDKQFLQDCLRQALREQQQHAGLTGSGNSANSSENKKTLSSIYLLAYQSYECAEKAVGNDITDREAYEWLVEYGYEEYEPPVFETWQRYLRRGRSYFGTQKNSPRAGRNTGRSAIKQEEIQSLAEITNDYFVKPD